MPSLSRTGRRYLRRAGETTHDFQVFLDENPMVAQGLATVGSLVMNAVMQSKYGPVVQELMNPGSTPPAENPAAKPAAMPKAAKGKVARTKPMVLKPAAKKTAKKRVLKKKAVRRKVAKKI